MQEFYADFVANDPYHFSLNVPSNYIYMVQTVLDPSSVQHFCDRAVDGIAAVFLALKRRPIIRYQRTSDIAKRIAQETGVSKLCANGAFLDIYFYFSFYQCDVDSFYGFVTL